MKRYLAIFALIGSYALAGCTSAPPGDGITRPNITGPSLTQPGGVTDAIKQVQTTATQICSFQPTVNTVASLLNFVGVPYIGMASDIAQQICSAVTAKSARRGGARLHGVKIRGKFVR